MNRETALKAIRENVKNENLIKHMLAVEAIREKQMSPYSHYPATLRFGDNLLKVQIPRRYAPGIIRLTTQTSLCLFSSSLIIMRALRGVASIPLLKKRSLNLTSCNLYFSNL